MRSIIFIFCFLSCFLLNNAEKRGFGPGEQDYGYVTVRQGAHMFWWLFHTSANVSDSAERPLILWLMGGPGGSGTGVGNFMLVGPIDETLQPRENTWVKDYNILFVDNPVGAGYSFVENVIYFANDNKQIAKDLLEVMKAFYQKLPKFKKTPFYIYGISYGGKMAVDTAKLIHDEVKLGNIECNIQGIFMGNAWISPVDSALSYGPFLYEMGMVDEIGEAFINQQSNHMKQMYDQGMYFHTSLAWFRTMNFINYFTDGVDIYKVINKAVRNQAEDYESYLKRKMRNLRDVDDLLNLMYGPVKEQLNIPSYVTWGSQAGEILNNLFVDFTMPVTETIESLLNDTDIKIHVCNGNLDLIVDTPGVMAWINKLKWHNSSLFHNAPRITTWINNTMEGYTKQGGGLSFYWINVAGHDAITDNPQATREFLRSVTGI